MTEDAKIRRESFVFYRSYRDALASASDADLLAAWRAIIDYALDGEEPTGLGGVPAVAWGMARPLIDANNARYENGKRGGRPKKTKTAGFDEKNHWFFSSKPNENVNVNANENGNENENENGASAHFGPPSLQEIQDFVMVNNLNMDAQSFLDYYTTRGWMMGNGVPMADWRAACRRWATWEQLARPKPRTAEPTGYEVGRILQDNDLTRYDGDEAKWNRRAADL